MMGSEKHRSNHAPPVPKKSNHHDLRTSSSSTFVGKVRAIPVSADPPTFLNDDDEGTDDNDDAQVDLHATEENKTSVYTKSISKTRMSLVPKRPTKKGGRKRCKSFPCCLGLPLEIAVQILCVLDLIYSILNLVLWSTLLGMDLFSHENKNAAEKGLFIPPDNNDNMVNPFRTSTTTTRAPWTLRGRSTTQSAALIDDEHVSRKYSKIALQTEARHETIEFACGKRYLIEYLYKDIDATSSIWHDFLWITIVGEFLYILFSVILVMCVCCFIEHRGSKLLVMILWWVEFIPMFMDFQALIMCQSKRLCILEYAKPFFRGQLFLFIFICLRIAIFKPYQLLVHFSYIKEILVYGYLKDESVHQSTESEFAQKYFNEFYAMETQNDGVGGGAADGLMPTSASPEPGFDTLSPSEVATVQYNVMTGQDDPFSIRNQEIRSMQSGKFEQNVKSVRRT